MSCGIIVCGCNGSGKSTLGRELAKKLGYKFIDIEDCYFSKMGADYTYGDPRSRDEAESILFAEINSCNNFVLASVKGNFRIDISYECAVFISVPKEVRVQRVVERSYRRFGDRMLPGGDLYESEQAFIDMAVSRNEREVENWLDTLDCNVIRVDGTKAIEENVEFIAGEVKKCHI